MNGNATRFSQIISLDFDQAGQVASASVQVRGRGGPLGAGAGPSRGRFLLPALLPNPLLPARPCSQPSVELVALFAASRGDNSSP